MSLKEKASKKSVRNYFIVDNITLPGVFRKYGDGADSLAIINPEFGNTVMAGILKNEGVICSLLSGENIRVSRSTTDDIAIDNKRLTIIGGINMHDFIDIYLPDEDENKFVTTGLIPRTAIGIAQNLAGTRKHHPCPDDSPYFEIYESTMLSLLNNSKDYFFNSKNDRKKLFIDKDGKDFIRQLKINLEKAMAPGGIYERHKEHAVRIPEMTIRLGGNLHCYEGFEGDISEKTLMTAYKVCMYYSDCYMYFFNLPPQAEMDAYCLDKWFDEHYRDLGIHHELKNDARQLCKIKLRKNRRFYAALAHLVKTKKVLIYVEKNKEWIWFSPSLWYPSASPNGLSMLPRSTGFFD